MWRTDELKKNVVTVRSRGSPLYDEFKKNVATLEASRTNFEVSLEKELKNIKLPRVDDMTHQYSCARVQSFK